MSTFERRTVLEQWPGSDLPGPSGALPPAEEAVGEVAE